MLSADHGGPEVPGYLKQFGINAGYVTPESWDKKPAFMALKKKFGIDKELISEYNHPYVYLNHEVISQHKLNQQEVEQAVAKEL